LPLTPSASVTYSVGSAGTGGVAPSDGVAGGDTWFNAASMAACTTAGPTVCAGAKGGQAGFGVNTGGAGGAAGSGVGTVKNSGGTGGTGVSTSGSGGGGGAAGPNGAGNNGAILTGGSGDNGFGGAGGGASTAGSAGVEWDATHGSGGGGGGSTGATSGGFLGGNYGGGGSGSNGSPSTGGNGAPGIIVITYTPTLGNPHNSLTITVNTKSTSTFDVRGSISKGAGTFVIDDPLDPSNKLLYHSFVESPDVKNIYDGIVTLDQFGEAVVRLPDYYDALNYDTRYQYFPIDQPMPELYVGSQEKNNQFTLSGGEPGGTVSWQITGIRHDPYILKHPITPEVDKGPGQPVNKGQCILAILCR